MQAPPKLRLEMVPSHVAAPTVIVAGWVVGIRSEARRSCCGRLPGTIVEIGVVVMLFASEAGADWAGETVVGQAIILGVEGATAGRRSTIRRGPCIGAQTSNAPSSWLTS